ncbi:hypothetical protein R6Q57_009156 [Mikania cordata]
MPREIFKGVVEADEPAPAPKAAKKKKAVAKKKGNTTEDDAEAPGPDSLDDYSDDDAADQTASGGGRWLPATVVMTFCFSWREATTAASIFRAPLRPPTAALLIDPPASLPSGDHRAPLRLRFSLPSDDHQKKGIL